MKTLYTVIKDPLEIKSSYFYKFVSYKLLLTIIRNPENFLYNLPEWKDSTSFICITNRDCSLWKWCFLTLPLDRHHILCYLSWQPYHFPAQSTMSSTPIIIRTFPFNPTGFFVLKLQHGIVLNWFPISLYVQLLLLMSCIYLVLNHIACLLVMSSKSDLNSGETIRLFLKTILPWFWSTSKRDSQKAFSVLKPAIFKLQEETLKWGSLALLQTYSCILTFPF